MASSSDPVKPGSPAREPKYHLVASLPNGELRLTLESESGTIKLFERSGMAVYLDYNTAGAGLEAKVRCEPWAIAAVDSVSIGKTPVALPPFLGKTLELDLRRPGIPPIELKLSAKR